MREHGAWAMRAVCFDLDGVLIDTMRFHASAWLSAARSHRVSVRREEVYQWEGEPGMATARRLLRRSGRHCSRASCRALLDAKERRFSAMGHAVAVTREWSALLSWLQRQQVPLGLVTGTSSGELARVVPAQVRRRFSVVVTGNQVKRGKPHPEPYQRAFTALRVAPRRVVVVENAPYGIRSARRAGSGYVIGLTSSLPAAYLGESDQIVKDCAAVRAALAEVLYIGRKRTG
jgi:HAD superfamily hydrolase (TIGR01509 family)